MAAWGTGTRSWSLQTDCLPSNWRGLLLTLVLIVVMGTVDVVDAKTEFNGTYLPSLRALDLECTTDDDNSVGIQIFAVNRSNADTTPKLLSSDTPGIQIKDDYKTKGGKRKLHIRRLNYAAGRSEVTYTCNITKYNQNGIVETGEARHIHWIKAPPDITTTTSTSATTSVTVPVQQFTSIVPGKHDTEVAATVVNEEEPFSGVRLYVVVAISCVLVIVLVVFIMYYTRVRFARLRQEKMEEERTMDWDDAPPHTANQNWVSKSPASARIPLRDMQQESAPSHTHPQIHGQIRRGEREPSPTREPLLTPHSHRDRHRSSVTSEDEEERSRRRDRHFMSTPRSRPREAFPSVRSPGHSRSFDPLDWTESDYEPYLRSHRYSFPRHSFDNTSDEESDYPGYRRRSRSAHRYPRRSLSQQSLNRHPRHRHRSTGRSPLPQYMPAEFSPSHQLPERQRYRDGHGQPVRLSDSSGHRYFQDGTEVCYPQAAFPQGMPAAEGTPLAVRVCEENNVLYSNRFFPSETDGEGSCMREGDLYQDYEADRSGRGMPSSGAVTHTLPEEPARQSMHTEDVAAVYSGDPSRSRLDQPARTVPDARYPSHSMPSRRRRHHSPSPRSRNNSSSTLRHYNTASIPRPHERHPRSQGQIPHNRSFPQLYYVTEGSTGPQLRLAPEMELQSTASQPQSRQTHRSRSVSHSSGHLVEDGSPQQHGSGRLAEGVIPGQGKNEVPELPSPVTAEAQRQINLLSREELISSQDPTTALNVPVGNQLSALSMTATVQPHQDSTQRKTTMAGEHADNSTPRPPAQQQIAPGPSQIRSRGAAAVSDSSPNSTPPGHRRSSLSSSEEDNMRPRARKRAPGKRGREINIHDIKTDHETQCKRVESFKVSNKTRPPVVCAADMANSRSGAEHIQHQHGLQKRESGRSSASQHAGHSQRDRREAARSGAERGLEQFGVEVMSSYDPSCAGPCSQYTENNHSTVVKGTHPPQE